MNHRRCSGSSAAPASSLPDDDDLLREILLRLPPQPSSLPHASAVCERWRCLVTDPKFHRCFCAHHRKPPLLGVFERRDELVFIPVLDPPDRVPLQLVSPGRYNDRADMDLLGCRHGRALLINRPQKELLVCDPITAGQHRFAVPPEFKRSFLDGAVLCGADDQGHVHGGCHSSPFKVVLVSISRDDNRPFACVYSWGTGIWGDIISAEAQCSLHHGCVFSSPSTLVGNVLYWVLSSISHGILEFDLDRQSLALTKGPLDAKDRHTHHIIQAEDCNVGLATFSYPTFQIWQRKVTSHGVATWLPHKTVDMHNILRPPPQTEEVWRGMAILGYDEDNDVIFLSADRNAYMVELKSMQPRKLTETTYCMNKFHPFTSFQMAGIATAAGSDGAELQDTWDDSGFTWQYANMDEESDLESGSSSDLE